MQTITPGKQEFLSMAVPGKIISVAMELYTDTETPISLFKKVCEPSEHAFLLESVEME